MNSPSLPKSALPSGVAPVNPGALDRMRMEAHALWVEEAAPAALEGGGGVTEDAYAMSLPSCRLPTPRRVALLTSNLPDEDFWAWQRFEVQRHPGVIAAYLGEERP